MPRPVEVLIGLTYKPIDWRMPMVIMRMPAAASVTAMAPGCLRERNTVDFQTKQVMDVSHLPHILQAGVRQAHRRNRPGWLVYAGVSQDNTPREQVLRRSAHPQKLMLLRRPSMPSNIHTLSDLFKQLGLPAEALAGMLGH